MPAPRRATLALVVLAAFFAYPSAGTGEPVAMTTAPMAPDRDSQAAAPGELLVRFNADASADQRSKARAAAGAKTKRQLPLRGLELLDLPASASPRAAAARLEKEPGVEYAEPNWSRHAVGTVNDSLFPYDWGLNNTGQTTGGVAGLADADIDAPEAWDVATGRGVTVAVVDTGIDATHGDLAPKLWTNPGEAGDRAANGVDDDGDGLVDDVHGWDFVDGDADPADLNGHGTHVSGTIAAQGGDGRGVAGVAYDSDLMPLRVLDANGSGYVSDVVTAYRYAAAHGARIVNASLGSDSFSRAEQDAIAAAPGTLFVVAAGNGGADGVGDDVDQIPEYPCAYALANIVCVAATDSSDRLASFSNYGAAGVDLAAPGVDILSDWPRALGGSYAWLDGTSMATPHVSGTAALVASRFAGDTTADLRRALLDGADRISAFDGKITGGLRLNAYGALTAPAPAPAPPPSTAPATTPAPAPASAAATPQPPAPTSAAPVPAPTPARVPDTTPPIVSVATARRARASTLRRRGLTVRVSCSEACRIDTRVSASRSARASGKRLAHTAAMLRSAGRKLVHVRLSSSARRRFTALTRSVPRLRLELVVSDLAGNKRRVIKMITLVR